MNGPIKILVVDDDESGCKALTSLLRSVGYNVTSAATGEQALELTDSEQFQVIVSDLFLPGKSGLDISEERAEDFFRN